MASDQQVQSLQRELAEARAQLEAQAIAGEHASHLADKQVASLVEKLAAANSSKEALEKENAVLQTSVEESQSTLKVVQQSLHQVESEKEQYRLEVEALERSKLSVQGTYEQAKKETQELQARIQTLSSKVLSMTKANGEIDAKLQHVLGEKSRESMNFSKVEQEKAILETSNKWLQEELERKVVASNEERKKATQEYIQLKEEMNKRVSQLKHVEGENKRMEAALVEEGRSFKKIIEELKCVKEQLAEKETSFEKELQQTQRMAQLYRESSEEHARRSSELQGIVNELKTEIEQMHEKHGDTVRALEEQLIAATERAEEEASMRKKVVDAYQTEMFTSTPDRAREDMTGSEDGFDVPSAMKKSAAEMYAMYVEAEETLRKERDRFRKKEIYFEQTMVDLDKGMAMLGKQEDEYNRMKASYDNVLQEIEQVAAEKRQLSVSLKDCEGRNKALEQSSRSLEQQVKDLSQQVARLLHDAANGKSRNAGAFAGGNAGDVTTQFLVEFSTVEELQQQNAKLLKVNRELATAAEATKEEAAREAEQTYGDRVYKLETAIEDLKRKNLHTEEIFQKVAKQRDELRQLLGSAGGDLQAGRELFAAAASGEQTPATLGTAGTPATSSLTTGIPTVATTTAMVSAENLQYREMYDDLEVKFEEYKKKSNEEYSSLEKELSSAQNDLLSLKKEVLQAQGQCDYEKERSQRLSNTVDSHQKQIDNLLQRDAESQARANETERRLVIAQQNLESAEERMRALNNKVSGLESEKRILLEAEKRLTSEASTLSQEKFRLAAELDVSRKQLNEVQASSAQDVSKAHAAASKAAADLAEAQREQAVQKGRAEYAHREIAQLKEELKQSRSQFEGKLETTQADLSEMQRRASVAEAKRDLLQEAVRKSEEKIARLEIEKNARVSAAPGADQGAAAATPTPGSGVNAQGGFGPQGGFGSQSVPSPGAVDMKIKELHVEIKILREELASAQGALASETGHAKQFETLAHTAEEALKASQTDFQKFKVDAQNKHSSIEAEVKRLRMEIAKKDISIKELKQEATKLRQECEGLKHQVELEKANSKQATHQTVVELEREKQKVKELTGDVERLRKEIEEVRKAYDAEVVAHGDAVRRVTAAEASTLSKQARLDATTADLEKEIGLRKQEEADFTARIEQQVQQIADLQKKVESLTKHRDTLQVEMEKVAMSSNVPDSAALANTIKILRQEREAAELNLSLCEREVTRLRQENAVSKRSAEEARAQLSAEIERQTAKKTEEQESKVSYLEQISITRESNMALRSDNAEKQRQIESLQSQARETLSKLDHLNMQIKQKESEIVTVKEELRVALENAKRWEQRSAALSEKSANDIDAAEHDQLKDELNKSKDELGKMTKQKDDVESRLKLAQNAARQAQATGTNLKKQVAALEAKVKELNENSSKASAAQSKKQEAIGIEKDKKINDLVTEKTVLEAKVKELTDSASKATSTWKEKVKASLAAAEKSQQARKQALDKVRELTTRVRTLEGELAALKAATAAPGPVPELGPVAPIAPTSPITDIREAGTDVQADMAPVAEPSHKRKHVDAAAQDTEEEEPAKKLRATATEFTPKKDALPEVEQHKLKSPAVETLVSEAIQQAVNRQVESHPIVVSPSVVAEAPPAEPANVAEKTADIDITSPQEKEGGPAETLEVLEPVAVAMEPLEEPLTGEPVSVDDAMDAANDFLGTMDDDEPVVAVEEQKADAKIEEPTEKPSEEKDKEAGDKPEKKRKAKIVWNPK